jgi:hypothetical protein
MRATPCFKQVPCNHMPTIEIPWMYVDHRVRRKPQRLTSNDPIETARRNYSDCPSSRAGSPDRNLTFSRIDPWSSCQSSSSEIRSAIRDFLQRLTFEFSLGSSKTVPAHLFTKASRRILFKHPYMTCMLKMLRNRPEEPRAYTPRLQSRVR